MMLTIEALANYQVVEKPGVYKVKVRYNINENHLYEEDSFPRYLVGLLASTKEDLMFASSLLEDRICINYTELSNKFMTGVIWENSVENISDLPVKGETVIATFDYVESRLVCTGIVQIPRIELKRFDISNYNKSIQLIKKMIRNE